MNTLDLILQLINNLHVLDRRGDVVFLLVKDLTDNVPQVFA